MAHESHHHHQQTLGYTNFSSTNSSLMQSFEPNHELFGLQAGMEMLGIPSKHHHNPPKPESWRSFFRKAAGSSSVGGNENLMITPEAAAAMTNSWQQPNQLLVDDSSLRCLFPSQGNGEQPNQGLSLSLPDPEPSDAGIGLQQGFHHQLSSNSRDGLFSKPTNIQHQQQQQFSLMDGRFFPTYQLKSSMYLIPAQELLNEFCSLGGGGSSSMQKSRKGNQWEEGGSSSSSSWNQSLHSMNFLELQKQKAKLLSMLEEVDRRYKRYCEQMRAVVSSFEAVAGEGAATVYSALASKAMSRHFRCLRDGILSQIQVTKKAMGEKDPVAPGTTKGETPRLKLVDQCLRQQKAFQQAGVMESHPWRPQRGLPERSVSILRAWLFEHFLHPYPSDVDKHILARQTGLSRSQVSNWFINARVRLWKPMVEDMYLEETKEQDNQSSLGTAQHEDNDNNSRPSQLLQPNRNPNPSTFQDQKPPPGHLNIDSGSLSSIINTNNRRSNGREHDGQHHQQSPRAENFGVVDLDFSSYNDCNCNQNFGNGVSLTLGLQQHNGGGMNLSFSPASQQSLFFSRQHMEDCQPVQFSILDGEAQNLPYRNLMGAQLLHDLAGQRGKVWCEVGDVVKNRHTN